MDCGSFAWTEIISSSVVPVVIISASGLLCLTFYNRLAFIVTRLRTLQRERIAEYKEIFALEEKNRGKLVPKEKEKFLHFLEQQTIEVLKRARYLQKCIFWLITSIFSLVLTSLLLGISVLLPSLEIIAFLFYVLGLFSLLYGLVFAILEIKLALSPIQMESHFVQELLQSEWREGELTK